MTEHDKSSAVVEETRETVETTPQPETTEKTAEKKNGSNKTSLALSAIAIAIALAAGVGLYGLVKHQGANQTSTSDALGRVHRGLRQRLRRRAGGLRRHYP
mgnify:CR=1 FL=1